jgi:WhiB family redox-sensing transcriptional regulator
MRPTPVPNHHVETDSPPVSEIDLSRAERTEPASNTDEHGLPGFDVNDFRWMLHAACRGTTPSEFFPSDGVGVDVARRVCERCPVRAECLEYALAYRIEHGVWGGASERERRRILRRRRQISSVPDA